MQLHIGHSIIFYVIYDIGTYYTPVTMYETNKTKQKSICLISFIAM